MEMTMTTRSAKETWRDWMPANAQMPDDGELITREKLVARLRVAGEVIAPEAFLYWQAQGVLPYAIRRRRAGATRALYPPWMVWVVRALLDLQQRGYSLSQVRAILRDAVRGGSGGIV